MWSLFNLIGLTSWLFILYRQGGWFALAFTGIAFSIVFLPLLIGQQMNKQNKDKALFEITDDKLLIKGDFAEITEYPLKGFNGIIKTQRGIIQQYLYAPGFRGGRWPNHILISVLPKEERLLFIETLKNDITKNA